MSTTITHPTPAVTEPALPAHRTSAVLALARFEARELLFQIPVVFFFLLYAGLTAYHLVATDGMDDYPVLHMVDRGTQSGSLLCAIALLICVNAAALRSRRHGTADQFGVLPMEPWRRTLAHVLSVVPYTLLTALLVATEYSWEALKPGAIGEGSLGELAVGPLVVLLSGVAGALLARVAPSPFAPMVFAVAAYLLAVMLAAENTPAGVRWLLPIAMTDGTGGDPIPSDLLGRPAGWHALYLAGLCVTLTCVALLRSGGRTRAIKTATAVALAATAAGAIGQLPHDTETLQKARETASRTPEKVQSCTTYGTSKYCAFPDWNVVRKDWAEVVDRVQSAAGGRAAELRLTVRQRTDAGNGEVDSTLISSTTPGEVTVGTRWGGNRVPEFAVGVASVLVTGTEEKAQELCDARMVTIMWLVLGNDPTPLDTLQDLRVDDSISGSAVILAPTDPLTMSADQTTVVRELLERPRQEIDSRVKAHWTELTSAQTSTAAAARLLDVEVPKGAEPCEV